MFQWSKTKTILSLKHFLFVLNDFIFKAYCENLLLDMKNESKKVSLLKYEHKALLVVFIV
jgi:hypothetical protein